MKTIYNIYFCIIAVPILLIVTILCALLMIVSSMLGFSRGMGYWPGVIWGRLFCLLSGVRVVVRGREHIKSKRSYVFVANHQGAYDIFAIYGYLGHNFRWMMKKALEKIPLVGYSCRVAGHIYVDNRNPAAVRETMQTAEKRLAGNMSVVVFPEGSRTLDGHMHAFRRGAYMLAVEFGLPVVPITIDGAYDVMKRTAKLPRPGKIILTIHKPITVKEGEQHDLAYLMERSAEAIASALPERNKPKVRS